MTLRQKRFPPNSNLFAKKKNIHTQSQKSIFPERSHHKPTESLYKEAQNIPIEHFPNELPYSLDVSICEQGSFLSMRCAQRADRGGY